jgi:LacI family transcriptional regulator
VYDVAHARGLRIPEDLSVIGYNDATMSRDVVPALTTVTYPTMELARRAMDACVGESKLESAQVVIPCELIVRKSVVAPKKR